MKIIDRTTHGKTIRRGKKKDWLENVFSINAIFSLKNKNIWILHTNKGEKFAILLYYFFFFFDAFKVLQKKKKNLTHRPVMLYALM